MKINDPLTQALAKTVKDVISPEVVEEKVELQSFEEGKMKELHMLVKKGVKDPKKIAKELGLANDKKVHDAVAALIAGMKEQDMSTNGVSGKAFRDLHLASIEIIDDPEQEKQFEGKEKIDEIEVGPSANLDYNEEEEVEEELSAKQKKIDLNKNGKIDGEDLAKLRKTKKEEAPEPKGDAKSVKAPDEEEDAEDNSKEIKKSVKKQATVESYTEEFGDVILLDLSEGKEDMSSVKLQVSDPKKVHKQWHGITSIRVSMTKYDDEVVVKGKKKDLLRVLPKLGFDKNDIEDMYSHLLEGLTEALSKNDKTAGYAGRGQFELKRHIMPLVDKNKSLKDIYFDGPDLVGDTKKGKQTTLAKGVLSDKKMTVSDLEKVITNFKESTYSEDILNDILEKKSSEVAKKNVPESKELEEAIQPSEFVKGGTKKVDKDEVDKILNRILFNDRLQSTLEKSKAFKAGQKGKGKKKNPHKEDTLDYHHFELGAMEGQMG